MRSQAKVAVHADEDFQRDAGDGKLERVVKAIQANPATYKKCAQIYKAKMRNNEFLRQEWRQLQANKFD